MLASARKSFIGKMGGFKGGQSLRKSIKFKFTRNMRAQSIKQFDPYKEKNTIFRWNLLWAALIFGCVFGLGLAPLWLEKLIGSCQISWYITAAIYTTTEAIFVISALTCWPTLWAEWRTYQTTNVELRHLLPTTLTRTGQHINDHHTGVSIDEERGLPKLAHLVIMVGYKEPVDLICTTIDTIAAQTRAKSIIMVVGLEERTPEYDRKIAIFNNRYKHSFFKLIQTVHPYNLPGEIAGTCSNVNWAIRQSTAQLRDEGTPLDPETTLVTKLDTDALFLPTYFEILEREFLRLSREDRLESTFQSPLVYNLSLDERYFFTRVTGILRTYFMMGFLIPYSINTMSIYSLSLQLARNANYWLPQYQMEDIIQKLNFMVGIGKSVPVRLLPLPTVSGPTSGADIVDEFQEWRQQARRWTIGAAEVWHYFFVKFIHGSFDFWSGLAYGLSFLLYYGFVLCVIGLYQVCVSITIWFDACDQDTNSLLFPILIGVKYVVVFGTAFFADYVHRQIAGIQEPALTGVVGWIRSILHYISTPLVLLMYQIIQALGIIEMAYRGREVCGHIPANKTSLMGGGEKEGGGDGGADGGNGGLGGGGDIDVDDDDEEEEDSISIVEHKSEGILQRSAERKRASILHAFLNNNNPPPMAIHNPGRFLERNRLSASMSELDLSSEPEPPTTTTSSGSTTAAAPPPPPPTSILSRGKYGNNNNGDAADNNNNNNNNNKKNNNRPNLTTAGNVRFLIDQPPPVVMDTVPAAVLAAAQEEAAAAKAPSTETATTTTTDATHKFQKQQQQRRPTSGIGVGHSSLPNLTLMMGDDSGSSHNNHEHEQEDKFEDEPSPLQQQSLDNGDDGNHRNNNSKGRRLQMDDLSDDDDDADNEDSDSCLVRFKRSPSDYMDGSQPVHFDNKPEDLLDDSNHSVIRFKRDPSDYVNVQVVPPPPSSSNDNDDKKEDTKKKNQSATNDNNDDDVVVNHIRRLDPYTSLSDQEVPSSSSNNNNYNNKRNDNTDKKNQVEEQQQQRSDIKSSGYDLEAPSSSSDHYNNNTGTKNNHRAAEQQQHVMQPSQVAAQGNMENVQRTKNKDDLVQPPMSSSSSQVAAQEGNNNKKPVPVKEVNFVPSLQSSKESTTKTDYEEESGTTAPPDIFKDEPDDDDLSFLTATGMAEQQQPAPNNNSSTNNGVDSILSILGRKSSGLIRGILDSLAYEAAPATTTTTSRNSMTARQRPPPPASSSLPPDLGLFQGLSNFGALANSSFPPGDPRNNNDVKVSYRELTIERGGSREVTIEASVNYRSTTSTY